ncbi:MAG: UDP-3-O-(3-hydroxymyristoyl)glucosamine N-acyltransferase [Bacteroidota bacterium]
MQITASELCQLFQGSLEGDGAVVIYGPSKIEEGKAGTISFLANPKYESHLYTTEASAVLVSRDFQPSQAIQATLIRVDDVYGSIALLLDRFGQEKGPELKIAEEAKVHATATLGANVSIGAFCVVEAGAAIGEGCIIYPQVYIGRDVKIGKNSIIYPGVKIYRACQIGERCIVHANAVIGCEGFGFAPQADKSYKKVAQIGHVVLEDEVEIGANTVIDRAVMGATRIGKGSKLDNLIQVAHNVEIGEHTVIAAQAGIAGSTKVGKHCMIGGQAGFVGHIQVADGTKVQAQSGVAKAITKENTAVYGSPALAYTDYLRSYAVFRQLPTLQRQLKELERKLAANRLEE